MQHFLENTIDCIWAVDKAYKILYLNNAFQACFKKFFGVELKLGDNILEKLPIETAYIWKNRYDKALKGQRFSYDESFVDKTLNTTYVQVLISPIESDNKITSVVCSGRDITQNKLNEIELQKYSLLLNASLESHKETILLSIDNNYNYMYFNLAHYEVMNYAYDKKIEVGMNILDCITNIDDKNTAIQNYNKALGGESHSNIRVYGEINKECYESFFNPIRNNENEIIGATVMARNISKRIKREEELRNSEKSLKDAVVIKNKFFNLISHDLKSPISSITSLTNLLLENFDKYQPEKQKILLQSICNGLDNTYALLEDLLLWSRSQNKSIVFDPVKINLTNLVNEIIDVFSQSIEDKELQIIKNYPSTFIVWVDKEMISTVIRNLLSNAIKFTYNKGVIEIKFEKLIRENNNEIEISICDDGVGIPKEKIDKVFRIGEFTSTRGTNNEKGTGFGLIMCKEFVENHSGRISIESEINQGTKISVLLPEKYS